MDCGGCHQHAPSPSRETTIGRACKAPNIPMHRTRGRKILEARLQEIIEQQVRLQEQKRALAAAQRSAARARALEVEGIIGQSVVQIRQPTKLSKQPLPRT